MLKKFSLLAFLVSGIFLSGPAKIRAQTGTQLILYPASIKRQLGEVFAVEVRIKTSEQILGTDLDIIYDSALLEAQKITPADFFSEPQILTNQIDSQNALIKFSIFSYPLREGSGSIAIITFKSLKKTNQSSISFAPTTAISGLGNKKIVFTTTPVVVEISPKEALPTLVRPNTPSEKISPNPFKTPAPTSSPPKPNPLLSVTKYLGVALLLLGGLILILTLIIL